MALAKEVAQGRVPAREAANGLVEEKGLAKGLVKEEGRELVKVGAREKGLSQQVC